MRTVYLDHAATTPLREEVRAAMEPYGAEVFGNPSSLHRWGRAAYAALEGARAEIASALGARPSEIRLVRGGTESDNLAVLGATGAHRGNGEVPTVAVTRIEHSAVLEPAEHLEQIAHAEVAFVEVGADGSLDWDMLEGSIANGPGVVSVMWVNNETGLELPIAEVTERVGGDAVTIHTDASQAIGKVPVNVADVPVDLLTATGHKISGPRGMGILFVRDGVQLDPLLYGGGQERALRPGTEDVAGAVGLATAVRLAVQEQEDFRARVGALRDALEERLRGSVADLRVNCAEGPRAPHVSSLGLGGIADGEALLMALDLEGVAVSGGSACHSGAGEGSHVIAALYGETDETATVRFSFGLSTSEAEVDQAVSTMARVVERLRGAA